MNKNELKTAMIGAIKPDFTKFSQADADKVVIDGILETFGLVEADSRQIRAKQKEIFALIEEVIEEQLPKAIEDVLGGFVETKTFGRDDEVVFKINNTGKRRARLGIVEGARGGIYKARRTDNKTLQIPVKTETVSVYVTLEEILSGSRSLSELMANIRDGFVEKIYVGAVKALRTAKTLAPSANIASGAGVDADKLDELVRIVSGYGTPVIMGFRSAISKITNMAGTSNPNISSADMDDIRNKGFVAIYKGVPVVEIPNYLIDETNSGFAFKEGDIFILPTDSKPVKVAMKGDLVIIDSTHPSGSEEQQAHRLIGIGLYLANNIAVYTDTEITDDTNLY